MRQIFLHDLRSSQIPCDALPVRALVLSCRCIAALTQKCNVTKCVRTHCIILGSSLDSPSQGFWHRNDMCCNSDGRHDARSDSYLSPCFSGLPSRYLQCTFVFFSATPLSTKHSSQSILLSCMIYCRLYHVLLPNSLSICPKAAPETTRSIPLPNSSSFQTPSDRSTRCSTQLLRSTHLIIRLVVSPLPLQKHQKRMKFIAIPSFSLSKFLIVRSDLFSCDHLAILACVTVVRSHRQL